MPSWFVPWYILLFSNVSCSRFRLLLGNGGWGRHPFAPPPCSFLSRRHKPINAQVSPFLPRKLKLFRCRRKYQGPAAVSFIKHTCLEVQPSRSPHTSNFFFRRRCLRQALHHARSLACAASCGGSLPCILQCRALHMDPGSVTAPEPEANRLSERVFLHVRMRCGAAPTKSNFHFSCHALQAHRPNKNH